MVCHNFMQSSFPFYVCKMPCKKVWNTFLKLRCITSVDSLSLLVFLPRSKIASYVLAKYKLLLYSELEVLELSLLNCGRLAFAYIPQAYEHYSGCSLHKSLHYVVLCLVMSFSILRSRSALLQIVDETVKEQFRFSPVLVKLNQLKVLFGKIKKCWGQGLWTERIAGRCIEMKCYMWNENWKLIMVLFLWFKNKSNFFLIFF